LNMFDLKVVGLIVTLVAVVSAEESWGDFAQGSEIAFELSHEDFAYRIKKQTGSCNIRGNHETGKMHLVRQQPRALDELDLNLLQEVCPYYAEQYRNGYEYKKTCCAPDILKSFKMTFAKCDEIMAGSCPTCCHNVRRQKCYNVCSINQAVFLRAGTDKPVPKEAGARDEIEITRLDVALVNGNIDTWYKSCKGDGEAFGKLCAMHERQCEKVEDICTGTSKVHGATLKVHCIQKAADTVELKAADNNNWDLGPLTGNIYDTPYENKECSKPLHPKPPGGGNSTDMPGDGMKPTPAPAGGMNSTDGTMPVAKP